MKILISDQDRKAMAEAIHGECLRLGINGGYRYRLVDAALAALSRSPEVEMVYAVEGQWSRPESSAVEG